LSPTVLGERILHPLFKDQARVAGIVIAMRASEERAVIIRVFKPTIHPGKESEFESFLRDTAVPLVSRQAGLVAQHVGRSHNPSSTEYVYVTVWQDVESIRAFAGERWQDAVIAPDEEHLLKDTWIAHYEVLPMPG
jgi:heme-degrading monooxygenase HmoA